MTIKDRDFRAALDELSRTELEGNHHPPVEDLAELRAGRLSGDAAEELRDHLAACPDCAALMLELDEFQASLAETEPSRRRRAVNVAPWMLSTAAALLILLGLGLFLSLRENRRLADLVELRRPELDLPATLAIPQADLPFATLTPRDFARAGDAARVLEVPPEAAFFALHLATAHPEPYPEYFLRALSPDGQVGWRLDGLVSRETGFALLLRREALVPGRWRLELVGVQGGREDLVEEYDVEIRQPR